VPRLVLPLAVLLGGVLLHSMNVLITATLLPSIVADIGGGKLMSWPTTAFVAASIIAATGTAVVSRAIGNRRAFCGGAVVYAAGAVLCALAPSFVLIIGGRFVQGLGSGLLSALAYVLVRSVFAEPLWPRVFGMLAGVWSVTVLAVPLIGGVFAGYGNWRGAFLTVAGVGGLLATGVPGRQCRRRSDRAPASRAPGGLDLRRDRSAVMCRCVARPGGQGHAHRGCCRSVRDYATDRSSGDSTLLPSDAFSLRSPAGAGLWMVLLLSVAYSPLAIYVPLFLQRLHGLEPLPAGYMVAAAPLAWTGAVLTVASFAEEWPRRLIVAGPIAMSVSLLGVAALIAPGPVAGLLPPIALIGIGIGASWAFIAQRVMSGAKDSEETVAAASLATVQQAGIALGAAIAGLVANASGIGAGLHLDSIRRAAFWVPLVFVAAPVVACALCIRSNSVTGRSGRTSALAANKGSNLGRP